MSSDTDPAPNQVKPLIKYNRNQLAQLLQDDAGSFLFALGTITNSGSWAIIRKSTGEVQNLFITDIA